MSDCSCIYVDIGDDPNWFKEHMVRVNSSVRRCRECGKFFRPLEKHEKIRIQWYDKKPEEYRTCVDCVSVREKFFCEGYFFTRIWEDIQEHISEMDGVIDSSCIVDLPKRGRDMLCDRIEQYWDDHPEEEQ